MFNSNYPNPKNKTPTKNSSELKKGGSQEWWENDANSDKSNFDICENKTTSQAQTQPEQQSPYIYTSATIQNQKKVNVRSHHFISQFMHLFRVLVKVSGHCILPFKESTAFYSNKFVSEKVPLMMLSSLCSAHPWFLDPYRLAEELTLIPGQRVLQAKKNMEILYFKSEKMLEMELFSPLRGEFVQNDFEKLAILDSYKILSFLYMNTYFVNSCFFCLEKSQKLLSSDGPEKPCTGTCQFNLKSQGDESKLVKQLFQLGNVKEDIAQLQSFTQRNKGKMGFVVDSDAFQEETIKKLRLVIKHKNFIPKKGNSRMVEI